MTDADSWCHAEPLVLGSLHGFEIMLCQDLYIVVGWCLHRLPRQLLDSTVTFVRSASTTE